MSKSSRQTANNAGRDRTERVHRWTAALLTALLHVSLLVLLMMPVPPTPMKMASQQGEAGGGRMEVTLTDETPSPTPPEPEPPVHKPIARKKPTASHAIKRPLSTPVAQATVPMPAEAADTPTEPPTTAPETPDSPSDALGRPVRELGQSSPNDAARANAALAAKLGGSRGRSNNSPPAPAGPDMEVDGFHVYYELVDETRLRAWRDQGMTELFLPMPGTRRLMVCPLEVALHRGSGRCRMVEQDSPELESIGDAREVINIDRVYQWGDMVWSGPGPYR